jgi:hypothetical protein
MSDNERQVSIRATDAVPRVALPEPNGHIRSGPDRLLPGTVLRLP